MYQTGTICVPYSRQGGCAYGIQVRSLGLQGVSGYEVSAECDLSSGLPAFTLVGLPDAAVNEAGSRCAPPSRTAAFSSRSAASLSICPPPM